MGFILSLRKTNLFILKLLSIYVVLFILPSQALAVSPNPDVTNFVTQSLNSLVILAGLATTFFVVKGGYEYITSTGKPDALVSAKKTLRNALIGLIIVIGSAVFSSYLNNTFNAPTSTGAANQLSLKPIETVKPADGLTQVLIDAVFGFMQNLIQSSTKPLVDGIISFLTITPAIATNSVLFNFWLIILGITDSLFVLVIALLGFHFMAASTFGFEEIEFKHLLPKIGLAFLAANMSIFIVDWIVLSSNTLVTALLNATGGISQAWVLNAFDVSTITSGNTALITLVFMLLFIILSVVLIFFYISRLIVIGLGAVLSPLICLLWLFPKSSDFAEIAIKTYVVTVYTVFVHVVIIQLASSFLSVTKQSGANPLISVLVAIGLFFTLLKVPGTLMQMVFYSSGNAVLRKVGGKLSNILSSKEPIDGTTQNAGSQTERVIKTSRKVVAA